MYQPMASGDPCTAQRENEERYAKGRERVCGEWCMEDSDPVISEWKMKNGAWVLIRNELPWRLGAVICNVRVSSGVRRCSSGHTNAGHS